MLFLTQLWSAPAKRSGDGALEELDLHDSQEIQSGVVAAALQIKIQ
jgi:hypothetical protein